MGSPLTVRKNNTVYSLTVLIHIHQDDMLICNQKTHYILIIILTGPICLMGVGTQHFFSFGSNFPVAVCRTHFISQTI